VRCRGQTLFSSQTAESPRCETGARWSSLPVAGSCVAAGAQDRVCLPRPVRSIARRVGHTPVATTVVRMVEVERLAWQHRLGTKVAGPAVGVGEQLCTELVVVPAVTQRSCSQQSCHQPHNEDDKDDDHKDTLDAHWMPSVGLACRRCSAIRLRT
jgi:hypothetical protein